MFDAYLEAVRVLVARDAALAPRLHVFGKVTPDDVRRVQRDGLASHVVFMGVVSYTRSLALMRSARSLLLLLPDGDVMATCVPSKLYPYLFTGRPVLALVPPGDAARVVAETAAGDVIAPGDASANAARIMSFVERVRRGEWTGRSGSDERVAPYAMERVALRVHEVLGEVATRG